MKTPGYLRICFYALCALMFASVAYAQRTTRNKLRPAAVMTAPAVSEDSVVYDTIAAPEPHTLDINGYDKPLRSRRETFLRPTMSRSTSLRSLSQSLITTLRAVCSTRHRTVCL